MDTPRKSPSKRHRVLMAACFGLVTLFAFGASAGAGEAANPIRPPILSAAEIDYPPFSIVDADGRATGFSVELLRAVLRAMGREVTFRTGPWAQVRGWLEKGEVQALPLVGRTPEREFIYDFTFPYMSLHGAIVVRKDTTDIRDLADLKGRRVAVMKADNAEEFLRREERGIEIHTTATFEHALRELSEGRYDAVVIQRLVALRLIQETGLTNLRVVNQPIDGFRQDFCFAVKEGDRDTLALLNEGLALGMADGTYRRLHAKWFAALELPSNRRIVIGGDRNYPPYEYLDEQGRPAGFNVELTRAIALETGLDIVIRLGPWAEMIRDLESGKIDALQGMFYSPERDLKFDFTQAHTVNHCVSVVRKGEGPPPATLDELAGKRIVVQQGDIMHDFAVENGLGTQVSTVDAQEDALRELAEGKHDCALVARLTALYWIEKHGWKNLIVGRRPFLSPEYCYAVPNNSKALLSQFSEGLKVLEETGEYRRIREKWMGVYEESPLGLVAALRYAAVVLIPLLAILIASFVWTWSLRRQVARRTQELQRSEEFQKAMIACSPVAIYGIDPHGNVLAWNASAERVLGWKAEEVIGRPLPIVPEDKQEEFAGLRKRLMEGGAFAGMELVRRKKDGGLFHASLSTAPIHDAKGNVIAIMATIEDVTERKRSEEALRQSEERYRTILEQSGDGYFEADLAGNLTLVNDSLCRILGYPREELIGMNYKVYTPKEDVETVFQAFNRMYRTGEAVRELNYRAIRKDGSYGMAETAAFPIRNENGQITGFRGIRHDITERRRAEEERDKLQAQLQQAQKMESVGRLAGGVAHDYNNMLGVIIGYAELALGTVDPADPLHADLREILAAANRSAEITRQLLAFARKQTISPEVLDLNDTVEGMLKMLRRLIGEDIDLAWVPETDLWPVRMDPAQLDQILANLCVNARDAIAGVGKVTIETDKVTFDEAYCADHAGFVPGDYVMLAVSDDGCGMDRETLDNLFEPFFTTKELGKGTGLGLATVYGIVRQNNGFIHVYSEPGKGSTFKIYLPRHEGRADETRAESARELSRGRGETVLVVEDEGAIRKLAVKILEKLGYTVLSAGAVGEAVALAERHAGPIHLLMTDVVMPEMNGRDLADQLHTLYPDLKTLFMSGYTADVIAHRGVLDEGVRFIQKPFSTNDLASKVRAALDSN